MYNNELYYKLEAQFGAVKMKVFAEVMAARHELLYLEHISEGYDFTEEDHERDWWMQRYQQITDDVIPSRNEFDEEIEQNTKFN